MSSDLEEEIREFLKKFPDFKQMGDRFLYGAFINGTFYYIDICGGISVYEILVRSEIYTENNIQRIPIFRVSYKSGNLSIESKMAFCSFIQSINNETNLQSN